MTDLHAGSSTLEEWYKINLTAEDPEEGQDANFSCPSSRSETPSSFSVESDDFGDMFDDEARWV